MIISCEKVTFVHDLSPTETTRGLFVAAKGDNYRSPDHTVGQKPQILVWSRRNALEARATLHRKIHLEQRRSIVVDISSGHNTILQGQLVVRAGSAGLRLHMSEAELIEGESNMTHQAPIIRLGKQAADSILKIRIPYKLETEMKEIFVKVEVAYSTDHGDFTYGNNYSLSVLLPLGVNVQDIFKQNALFSKFTISASTSIPLRFLNCQLDGTRDFEAQSPFMDQSSLFISVKQPVCMIYKITSKNHPPVTDRALQTRLSLQIEYQCLDEEIYSTVQEQLLNDLEDSEFMGFSRLLLPIVDKTFRSRPFEQNLEQIGFLREIEIGSFHNVRWEQVLMALPLKSQNALKNWLNEWHNVRLLLHQEIHVYIPNVDRNTQYSPFPLTSHRLRLATLPFRSTYLGCKSSTLHPSTSSETAKPRLRLPLAKLFLLSFDFDILEDGTWVKIQKDKLKKKS